MNKQLLLSLFTALSTSCMIFSIPQKGSIAPNVGLVDQEGKIINISDFKGKKVALVFLPSTSGWSVHCKAQACSIKAGFDDLVDYGISLLCISADSQDKLTKFIKKNALTFPLVHANKEVIKAYDVNAILGIQRYTFLIDEEGKIVNVITKVNIDDHAQQIIDGFNAA
jgi:thioredoxin-dependent peroxiredoxin